MQQTKTLVILFKLGSSNGNQFRYVLGKHVEVRATDALGEPTWVHASQRETIADEAIMRLALQQLVDGATPGAPYTSNANGVVTLDLGWVKL